MFVKNSPCSHEVWKLYRRSEPFHLQLKALEDETYQCYHHWRALPWLYGVRERGIAILKRPIMTVSISVTSEYIQRESVALRVLSGVFNITWYIPVSTDICVEGACTCRSDVGYTSIWHWIEIILLSMIYKEGSLLGWFYVPVYTW